MKNIFVRLTLFCIAFVLVLSLNTFAENGDDENKYLKDAEKLEKVGIFKGDDDDGDLMLSSVLVRQDLVIIIARLYNDEDKAKKFSKNLEFDDMEKSTYYYPYVAWAVDKKIIQGVSRTEFGVDGEVTVQEFETILLRILGYEEEAKNWELVDKLSISLGITDDMEVSGKDNVTRGIAAKMIMNSLHIERKGSTLKLKDILNVRLK